MTRLRQLFAAAVKSLLRGKSLIQAFLAFWISPTSLKGQKFKPGRENGPSRTIEDFLKEVEDLMLGSIESAKLEQFALMLKAQFREGLMLNPECMLPSYNHQLPNGHERGQYLALDVGGSTLRVALVGLQSRAARGSERNIIRMQSFKISPTVKALVGNAFFDWIATRVLETVDGEEQNRDPESPLLMGLAWSFPIEQTSLQGGRLRNMGKGFLAAEGLLGQDLGDIIKSACKRKGLHIELAAIVNDSTAALLSEAYINEATRFSLILGTGVNIAAHLPIPTISREKYGVRPDGWFEQASHVVVNTELGMFGKGILPITRWDRLLNAQHPRPDFQPLEHLVSGYYLGEMCRYILIEAIDTTGIFGGVLPPSLAKPYSLDTHIISMIESDTSVSLSNALKVFTAAHPCAVSPTTSDIASLRTIASFVSRRSAAIVASSVFSLWQLKYETEQEYLHALSSSRSATSFITAAQNELQLPKTVVAYTGSVIENYPEYLANCQQYIDQLVTAVGGVPGQIDLVPAKESSLIGAAVALACMEGEKREGLQED